MIEKGHFLYFTPPKLAGGNQGTKKRYMLVIDNDTIDNSIKMINVSSLKGKEYNLLYDSNLNIKNFKPLPVPSFAKLNTTYIIDNFANLEQYKAFNNAKLSEMQLADIENKRLQYIKNNNIEIIQYTEKEFNKYNK